MPSLTDPIRQDPEAVWPQLRDRLCADPPEEADAVELMNAFEELLYSHADQFIQRIEALADECPSARGYLQEAYVGGVAASDALDRFDALQERLNREARA